MNIKSTSKPTYDVGLVPVVVEFLHIFVKLRHQAFHLRHIGVEPRRHLLGFQAAIRETRSQDRVRVELAERGLKEGHREGGGKGGEDCSYGGTISGDVRPDKLLGFGELKVCANDEKAFTDPPTGHLDFINKEVLSVFKGTQVVKRGYEHRTEDIKEVLQ